jgi:hypothetical protein
LRKRLLASSCLSVRPQGRTLFLLDGFSLEFIFEYFLKIYQKSQVWLKPYNNNRHFTGRRMYICNNSLTPSSNEKYFRQNVYRNQNTHFRLIKCFPKIVPFMR